MELAEDLERFLNGRPILARPTPPWERLAKWARRRPWSTAAIGGLVLLSFLLIGGGLYYNHRLRIQMRLAHEAEHRAAVDASSALQQRDIALKALDQLVFDVQERLGQTPATRSVRRSLLDTAIRGLGEIEHSTAGAARDVSQAVAYQKLGDIYRVIGQITVARQQYERSLRIAIGLATGAPDDPDTRGVVYQSEMGLGLVDVRTERFEEAQGRFRHAVTTAESLVADRPHDPLARRDLLEAFFQLGRAHSFAREPADAESSFRRMHDLAEIWAAEDPRQKNQARDFLASALRKLADIQKLFTHDYGEARRLYERAIAIGRDLVDADAGSDRFTYNLAIALDDLAGVARTQGLATEARGRFDEAKRLFASLVDRDLENLDYRIHLLHTLHHIAVLERDEENYEAARTILIRIRDEVRVLNREGRLEGLTEPSVDEHSLDAMIQDCTARLRTSG
jgi:tetratricopeptide (TPR) repeat protein